MPNFNKLADLCRLDEFRPVSAEGFLNDRNMMPVGPIKRRRSGKERLNDKERAEVQQDGSRRLSDHISGGYYEPTCSEIHC
jgi:hypothetical protein